MFIIFEDVLTNISLAERIFKSDPVKNDEKAGYRIEFEGGIRLGKAGKKYLRFDTAEERDKVYDNIKIAYCTDIFGEVKEVQPETVTQSPETTTLNEPVRKPGRPKGS